MKKLLFAMTGLASLALMAGAAPPPPPDVAKDPGYVDFARLGLVFAEEPSLRVSLFDPLLKFAAEVAAGDEAGLSALLSQLRSIQATFYPVGAGRRGQVTKDLTTAARALEERGWQTVVELNSPTKGFSLIQLKTDGKAISGLVVFFFDTENTAGTINIVGNVTPAEIARVARSFNLGPLSGVQLEPAPPAVEKQP